MMLSLIWGNLYLKYSNYIQANSIDDAVTSNKVDINSWNLKNTKWGMISKWTLELSTQNNWIVMIWQTKIDIILIANYRLQYAQEAIVTSIKGTANNSVTENSVCQLSSITSHSRAWRRTGFIQISDYKCPWQAF